MCTCVKELTAVVFTGSCVLACHTHSPSPLLSDVVSLRACVRAGVVGALWGALLYKEITGKQNFIYLGLAFVCVVTSAVLISLSK